VSSFVVLLCGFVQDHRVSTRVSLSAHTQQFKSKVVLEITPSRTVPGSCPGCPDSGRMMLQFEQAGNGEGLKNRLFTCTPNLLKSLVLLTAQEGM